MQMPKRGKYLRRGKYLKGGKCLKRGKCLERGQYHKTSECTFWTLSDQSKCVVYIVIWN